MFGVYRDPATVFDEDSMRSLVGRPVTRGHPPNGVTADNWKELTVGQVGGRVVRDGEHVVAPMAIMDADAAKEVHGGARALSAGYTCQIVQDAGTAPDGTEYQFRQAGPLRFNHVAYLPDNNPRAGNTRIGDAWATPTADQSSIGDWRAPGGKDRAVNPTRNHSMSDTKTRTVMVDGLPVECTDASAIAIDKLQKTIGTMKLDHEKAIGLKDGEIGELKVENKKLLDSQTKPADLDRLVAARAQLVSDAASLAPNLKTEGLADAAIRKAVVESVHGADFVKDASADEIAGMFRILTKDSKKDPVVTALGDARSRQTTVQDNGYSASVAGLDYRTRNQKQEG